MKHIELKVITNETCGCCKSYVPKLEELKRQYGIDIEYLDVNSGDMDLSKFDFKGIPFTVVYMDGMYHHHYQGDMPIERIKEQIGLS